MQPEGNTSGGRRIVQSLTFHRCRVGLQTRSRSNSGCHNAGSPAWSVAGRPRHIMMHWINRRGRSRGHRPSSWRFAFVLLVCRADGFHKDLQYAFTVNEERLPGAFLPGRNGRQQILFQLEMSSFCQQKKRSQLVVPHSWLLFGNSLSHLFFSQEPTWVS